MGGLGATYAVHLRLIRKFIVDFLLVIIELCSLGHIHASDVQTVVQTDARLYDPEYSVAYNAAW